MGKSILFEVIVGTYEEFVLGYTFSIDEDNNKHPTVGIPDHGARWGLVIPCPFRLNCTQYGVIEGELSETFATHSHRASVRSVACRGKLVVSGGADETINIYDMLTRKECGMLMEHNGTITSLSFTPDCSHVISTSEDGTIKIFRQGSWQVEKVWQSAHKGEVVTCLAVHPSGKMALSVGKDHTLRTWNLVKGRPAYTTNLYSRCRQLQFVVWSPGGALFAIPMDKRLEISGTEKAGVLHTLDLPTKITTCTFLSDEVVCVGEESGVVSGHCVQSVAQLWSLDGQQRVRGLAYLHAHLVVATSNGVVQVYSALDTTSQPRLAASIQAGCRITSLALFDYKSVVKVKQEPTDETPRSDSVTTNTSSKIKSCNNSILLANEQKKRKSDKFIEENVDSRQTISSKKQIPSSKKAKLSNVVCHPKNQTWTVEVSKR